ncbi:hypothetical protein AAKU55_005827, partial [Oxalobacteraceae bacterium GrIS 1.11]
FCVAFCVFDKAFCLSSAEKEEYEAFRLFRQPPDFPTPSFPTGPFCPVSPTAHWGGEL